MRQAKIPLALVVISLLGSGLVLRQTNFPRAQPEGTPPPPAESGPPVTHELYCGLWRADGGFVSTIRIKNSLIVAPLEVTPVLFMADGTAYTLTPVRLAVSGVATVSVNAALAAAPPEIGEHLSAFGSAALRYTYDSPGHVLRSIEVLDLARSLIFGYPFTGHALEDARTQTTEGVWWRHAPEVGGFVA